MNVPNPIIVDAVVMADQLLVDAEVAADQLLVAADVGSFNPIYPPVYDGATTVTPSEDTQVLETNGFWVQSDITVLPIPYPDGNDLAYGNSSCLVGEARIGTAYVWTDYDGGNIAIINKAVVGTSVTV